MQYRFLFLFLIISTSVWAQKSVRFTESSLETAINLAKSQNKNIFIDTYASYCAPCKKLEEEFRDKELAEYLNDNFVSIRVDMEGENAAAYKERYPIVFLPTMLFLSTEGNLRMSIDHLLKAKDILKMAKYLNGDEEKKTVAAAPPPPKANEKKSDLTTATKTAPVTAAPKTEQPIAAAPTTTAQPKETYTPKVEIDESEGKILYVMGQDGQLPPHIIREEAYFRMQLMDGSHHTTATKYLATQDDWSTEVNMQFIHDFLNDARSRKFEYIIANRKAFEALSGKEQIRQSIQILVNKELERAFPRPTKKRIRQLKSYL